MSCSITCKLGPAPEHPTYSAFSPAFISLFTRWQSRYPPIPSLPPSHRLPVSPPPTLSLPPHPARRCRKPRGLCCHRSVDCGLPRGWHHAGQQAPSSVGAKTGVGLQTAAAVRLPHTTVTTPTNCHLNDRVNVVTQGQSLCFVRRSLPSIFLDQSTLMVWDTQEMLKLKPAIFFYFPFFLFVCILNACLHEENWILCASALENIAQQHQADRD